MVFEMREVACDMLWPTVRARVGGELRRDLRDAMVKMRRGRLSKAGETWDESEPNESHAEEPAPL